MIKNFHSALCIGLGRTTVFAGLALLIVISSSCGDTKKLPYFQGLTEGTVKAVETNVQPIIQKNDILSITVSSLNPEASAIFNAPNLSNPSGNGTASFNNTVVGYLVGPEGSIQFPVLGSVRVEGLTKPQLSEKLKNELVSRKLLVDPIVTIRHMNYKVSVLGEVARPGVYPITNEKVSIMEALGLAGDITIYGKKDNVLLIRENDKGERLIKRLDLNSPDALNSSYYYLQSNDVVYVEPLKDRVRRERNAQLLPIIFSVISLTIVIIDRVNIK